MKRAILSLCIDHDVSVRQIDDFMRTFAFSMETSENEFDHMTLLKMLLSEAFVASTFDAYRFTDLTK